MIWFNTSNCLYYRADSRLKIVECCKDKSRWTDSAYSYEEFIEAVKSGKYLIAQYQHESLENK